MTIQAEARRGGPGLDTILESLASGETSPADLIERPRLVVWLDARRRSWLTTPDSHPRTNLLVEQFRRDPASSPPVAAALAASDRDGHVRELAVRVMAARPTRELMPFLVLRCGDWAGPVRDAARAAVTTSLAQQPETFLSATIPIAARIAGRRRGTWATRQVRAATTDSFDRVTPVLLQSRLPVVRRLVFDVGTELGRWDRDDMVRFALREPDSVVRSAAADRAAAAAGKQGDVATLRMLAGARFAQVRAVALVELARLGCDHDVAAAADDPAALVRALGRTRMPDPAAHYRAAVAIRPTPAVIAGLAETGGYPDEAVLTPLLGHDDAAIRAAAVKALAALDVVPVERVVPLLQDPAGGVIREAASTLRPYRRRLPDELLWRLLGDRRPEVRRGAYRIIRTWGPPSALRAAQQLADDDDPLLALLGRDDVRRWRTSAGW